ncbi:MAG TPA: translation initiation factor IF-2 [Syntrophobacteraceae bacterium]|nr:translation initiation factor IF-2 [Syntrophobacteraceae bacterium]
MRVHELAKELNMNNKDLIDRILKLGIVVKNHMSTLTESAVLKIRQQFTEGRAETVEEKRIGRAIIRRRKKTTAEEELPPAEALGEGVSPVETEVVPEAAAALELPEVPAEAAEVLEAEAPVEPGPEIAAIPAEVEMEARPVVVPPPPPPPLEPGPPAEEIATVELPAPREPEGPAVVEPPAAVPEEPQQEAAPVVPEVVAPEAPVTAQIHEVPLPRVEDGEPAAEAEEEAEGAAKPKKAKKRRRKKVRKDEPARIIKLPEAVPEEPEDEVELLPIVSRLHVKTEDREVKEAPRKKRTRPEEAEKEAAEFRKRAGVRKEVVEREDLYSKKELAAQADRGRFRDRGRFVREPAEPEAAAPKPIKRRVRMDEAITIANLAKQMGVKAAEVIKKLLVLGHPASINQALDYETAALLASEFDAEVEKVGFEEEEILQVQTDRPEELLLRPPVVTVMGHVDHGKTSLLDAIRHTDVIAEEAGGITQHIGAYYVKLDHGEVVFLDTPGHEAFTAMRARGAKVTDLVILVVAADDGVMQQTVEAIHHAKAAEVPIIVAINKVDKPNANVERVRRELADHGLLAEEWGGDVTMVEISAKKRLGIEELLEMVLLQAELMELKANPHKPARGRVIEAKLDKGRGPVATILIQEGTLRAGDVYVCGTHSGRVRNMFNDRGVRLESAGPSVPVEVLGFSGVPNAGDDFIVLADEKQAKLVAEHRLVKVREKELSRTTKVTLESLFEQIQEGEIKELNVIVKTDVQGSLEAINESLSKLSTAAVKVNLIHSATGAITETDVMLASASNAIVIGFNLRADAKVQELAEQERVDLRYYDVIYQLLNDIKDAMVGMLEPVYQEHVLGRAEVRQTFHVPRFGTIAGSYMLDGRVERGARVRLLRDQVVVYDGKISSLRRFKDDVKEVKAGFECGIGIENFNDIKVGDVLEFFELQEVKPTLEHEPEKRTGA